MATTCRTGSRAAAHESREHVCATVTIPPQASGFFSIVRFAASWHFAAEATSQKSYHRGLCTTVISKNPPYPPSQQERYDGFQTSFLVFPRSAVRAFIREATVSALIFGAPDAESVSAQAPSACSAGGFAVSLSPRFPQASNRRCPAPVRPPPPSLPHKRTAGSTLANNPAEMLSAAAFIW